MAKSKKKNPVTMPEGDITYCVGGICPRRHDCRRFTEGQNVKGLAWMFYPYEKDVECEYFLPIISRGT